MLITIFWFRRDLRFEDNTALRAALNAGNPVLPIFIFDDQILNELDKADARVQFIHEQIELLDELLKGWGSSLLCLKGNPLQVWEQLVQQYTIQNVFANKDYEPYAISRDKKVEQLLKTHHIEFQVYKDQVIFEEHEIVKEDGKPYTVYTPYKNKWLAKFQTQSLSILEGIPKNNFYKHTTHLTTLQDIGFKKSSLQVNPIYWGALENYALNRDFPKSETSNLSPHLRFGTISIRQVIKNLKERDVVFLSELIWREFFMQILFHFPDVVHHNFKRDYDGIQWRNNEQEFESWCSGKTGYPLIDAGMNELNSTGYMHNRVRMVCASFLCKHLLINWQWGEAYFAKKLLDYELSSNNGNWQWAAGTGCDAAPYFRIFNPKNQLEKFDKQLEYVKKWNPNYENIQPIVEHDYARKRALEVYKSGIRKE